MWEQGFSHWVVFTFQIHFRCEISWYVFLLYLILKWMKKVKFL